MPFTIHYQMYRFPLGKDLSDEYLRGLLGFNHGLCGINLRDYIFSYRVNNETDRVKALSIFTLIRYLEESPRIILVWDRYRKFMPLSAAYLLCNRAFSETEFSGHMITPTTEKLISISTIDLNEYFDKCDSSIFESVQRMSCFGKDGILPHSFMLTKETTDIFLGLEPLDKEKYANANYFLGRNVPHQYESVDFRPLR